MCWDSVLASPHREFFPKMKLLAVAFALFAVARGTYFIHEHHPYGGEVADAVNILSEGHQPHLLSKAVTDDVLLQRLAKILKEFEQAISSGKNENKPAEVKIIAEALENLVNLKSQVRKSGGKDSEAIIEALTGVEDGLISVLANVEEEDKLSEAILQIRGDLRNLEHVAETEAEDLNAHELQEIRIVHDELDQLIKDIEGSKKSVDVLPYTKEVVEVVKDLIDNLDNSANLGQFDQNLEGLKKGLQEIQDAVNTAVNTILGSYGSPPSH